MRIAALVVVGLAAGASVSAGAHAAEAGCACQRADVKLTVPGKSECEIEKGRAELSGVALVGDPKIDGAKRFMAISNAALGDKRDAMLQIYEGDPSKGYTWKKRC